MSTVRLVTFNISSGRSPRDGRFDPDRLARDVARLDPDVLALQEVDRGLPRSQGRDLTALAADAMGASWARFVPALAGTPGTPGVDGPARGPAGYGVALLSRFPARSSSEVHLPGLGFPIVAPLGRPCRLVVVRDEPRAAVCAVLDAPGGRLAVTATHLSFLPGWNAWQLRRLLAATGGTGLPQLLMGDLNTARPLAPTWRRLGRAATFPAERPRRQLDHVLARGVVAPVRSVAAVLGEVSDHRALVVELGDSRS